MYYCMNCGHSEDYHFNAITVGVHTKNGYRVLDRDHDFCKYIIRRYDTPRAIGERVPGRGMLIYGFKMGEWCNCKDFEPIVKDIIST